MRKRCLEEGLLQAYMDGELSQDAAAEAAAHLAHCGACAEALATAAAENDFLSAALGPEEHLSVPTEALRARVYAAVARLEDEAEPARPARANFGGLLSTLSGLFSFTPQRAAAFASVLAVVAFAAVFFFVQKRTTQPQPGTPGPQIARTTPAPVEGRPNPVIPNDNPAVTDNPVVSVKPEKDREIINASVKRASPRRAASREVKREAEPELLPGEKGYVEAIASLSRTVELGGDAVLRPAARADYERNLAVVDRAIEETRRVAKSNPRDPEAVSFLLTAYQSKVDLLTTVAEQAQVAAVSR